jgi:predicted metal-dependent hydrolase
MSLSAQDLQIKLQEQQKKNLNLESQLTQLKSAYDKLKERIEGAVKVKKHKDRHGNITPYVGKHLTVYNYALVELTPEEMEKNDE